MSEKLIDAFTLKLAESQLTQLRGLAEADGIGVSELLRNLIDREIESRRRQYRALASVFGQAGETTKDDSV